MPSSLLFLFVLALLLFVETMILFGPTSSTRGAGRSPYVIELVAGGERIGQSFRILDDGLQSADVIFVSSTPASLVLTCRLLVADSHALNNGTGAWRVVNTWTTTVRLPRGKSRHGFSFRPIFPSEKQIYQFQVEELDLRPLDPLDPVPPLVGLLATKDNSLEEGNVVIGQHQLADRDLFFQAQTASVFTTFRLRANPLLPRALRSVGVQLVALALYNAVLAVFGFQMILGSSAQDGRDQKDVLAS